MRLSVRVKATIVLTFAALAGCANSGGRPLLTIWHAWGGAELTTLKGLIKAYQVEHPDIELLALQIPHDRLLDKFTRSAASNGGPDLLIGDNDWSGKLAESELLAPVFDLSENAASGSALFSSADAGRFPTEVLGALRVGQKVFAWPESVETVVLYYNRKLLPKPPVTVPEMLSAAAATKIPDGYGLAFNSSFYFFAGYFLGGGGHVFDPAGTLALNTPQGARMLAWLGSLDSQAGVLVGNDYGKADSLYKQGKAAMILNGPWALADYRAVLGADLGVAALPKLEDGRAPAPWIGVKCLMVNGNADVAARERSADFLRWIAQSEQQLTLADGAGHIPAVKDVQLPEDSPLRVFQAQVRTGTPKSADPKLALVWGPMDRAIQEVTVHGKPAAEALARAQQTVDAQLKAVQANR